ncbi:MAG: hypothetical protein LBR94_08220 [Desulfovibrio sp.]|nr:hypothetical protein [Desulfovibrio sp.]
MAAYGQNIRSRKGKDGRNRPFRPDLATQGPSSNALSGKKRRGFSRFPLFKKNLGLVSLSAEVQTEEGRVYLFTAIDMTPFDRICRKHGIEHRLTIV